MRNHWTCVFLCLAAMSCASPDQGPAAADAGDPSSTAAIESKVLAAVAFNEGPAVAPDGTVYFSEIQGNRILRVAPGGVWEEFRNPSGRANGLAFDGEGRLVACEGAATGGNRRVTRTNLETGEVEVLATEFEGKRLNSPNDLTIAEDGRIYFTDPRYGSQDGRELETEDVYLIRPTGELERVATAPDVTKPNGIALSPDETALFVADTRPGPPSEARVVRFDVAEDGSLSNPSVHYSFGEGRGIDGMAIDGEGRIYGAAGLSSNGPDNPPGVYVISPDGELERILPVPEDSSTNCTLSADGKTLFVTAGKLLLEFGL